MTIETCLERSAHGKVRNKTSSKDLQLSTNMLQTADEFYPHCLLDFFLLVTLANIVTPTKNVFAVTGKDDTYFLRY